MDIGHSYWQHTQQATTHNKQCTNDVNKFTKTKTLSIENSKQNGTGEQNTTDSRDKKAYTIGRIAESGERNTHRETERERARKQAMKIGWAARDLWPVSMSCSHATKNHWALEWCKPYCQYEKKCLRFSLIFRIGIFRSVHSILHFLLRSNRWKKNSVAFAATFHVGQSAIFSLIDYN